ncbi:GNAT family N-acetyltransferase [Deinococcus cellulosilyticus]|uniref:N-acetyltransferase n=1 Tax=Deinococcus cellulosilyticus (strain DSM 18568 / NBRC 106333 / KACC 11606 / 5516J-15) TaxID=1223518 RepID=A0A511MV46_DEIC1|nr:GNAT family N-acetyltransferase [Deinococcus cellulosilyticus]GEM44452.1 N-acetyltransferase [Deinococcus cellulosilyticus NBRC 106333 = KACC 11606]
MLRIPMKVRLQSSPAPEHPLKRPFQTEDLPALADLMFAAYQGTTDFQPGSTLEDALEQIEKTIQGEYGQFLPQASFVLDDDGLLISATLITFWKPFQAPLLAFTMTAPEFKGQGLAALLLKASMNRLYHEGYNQLSLLVTDGNTPAQRLYQRLGFKTFEPAEP